MSHAFRAAVEARDVEAMEAALHRDVVFRSPAVFKPYVGREATMAVLQHVVDVFEDFRYTAEYAGPDGHVLEFACRVGRFDLQGVDVLRGSGPLTELTVLVRPYSAITALRDRMAEILG